jgi:hypothetical protein
VAIYSIPQQAVTNGYWKMEYLLAQPIRRSSFDVKNPGPSPESKAMISTPDPS